MQLPLVIVGLSLLLCVVDSQRPPEDHLKELEAKAKPVVIKELEKLLDKCRRCYADEFIDDNISNAFITVIKQNKQLLNETIDDFSHDARLPVADLVSTVYKSVEVQYLVSELRGGKMDPQQFGENYNNIFDVVYNYVKHNIPS